MIILTTMIPGTLAHSEIMVKINLVTKTISVKLKVIVEVANKMIIQI